MRLDKFYNPIFNETDVFNILYQGDTSVLSKLSVDITQDLITLAQIGEFNFPILPAESDSPELYHKSLQSQWFFTEEYKNFDIKQFCIDKCNSDVERTRIYEEFTEFERLGMIDLLRWCKYFVDTCTHQDVIWGVGRGSSVASYVLYIIGIHKIDSIKYNLDWREFLKIST